MQRNYGLLGMTFRRGGLPLRPAVGRLGVFAACPAELRGALFFFSFFFAQRCIDLSAAADRPQSIVGYLELSALGKFYFFVPEWGNSTKIHAVSPEEK
jgi:hypothetical protein